MQEPTMAQSRQDEQLLRLRDDFAEGRAVEAEELGPEEEFLKRFVTRRGMADLIALSLTLSIPVDEVRKGLFTAGSRVYWLDSGSGRRIHLLDDSDEHFALIERIDRRGMKLAVSGLLSTAHALEHVRCVCRQKGVGNTECEVVARPDRAVELPCVDEPFVPVGFSAVIPAKTADFWLDAQGASSRLKLVFGDEAPIGNEWKSYHIMFPWIITSPRKEDSRLMVTLAHPFNMVKRELAWKLR